jgi:hypothetical protein
MLAPVGTGFVPAASANVSVLAGTSSSVALAVKLRDVSSSTVCASISARIGALLTSFTVMTIVSHVFRDGEPLSATQTSNVYDAGPWASVGVQLKTPLVEIITAPGGTRPAAPFSRLKLSTCGGLWASVA